MEISTKFTPGDKVWVMHDNKPVEGRVTDIRVECTNSSTNFVYYSLALSCRKLDDRIIEHKVHRSKQNLLDSL